MWIDRCLLTCIRTNCAWFPSYFFFLIPFTVTTLNCQSCWRASWNVTCILSPFNYFVCSCPKGGTLWTKTDIKIKAQRVCRFKLQLLFFWTSAQNWIHSLEMEYLVFNSACELVMLEFIAGFISFCTCFYFNTGYIQYILLLRGSFIRSWKSGLILSCETFLKCNSATSGNAN